MKYRIAGPEATKTTAPRGSGPRRHVNLVREPSPLSGRDLLRLQQRLGARLAGGNRGRVLCDGRETFPAMLEAIAGAKESILLETYIYRHDRTGVNFYTALLDKLRQGLRVYLLWDSFGSAEAKELFDDLQGRGAHVCEVNPIHPFRAFALMQKRDHRKLLVVDGDVGFVGGLNIGNEYLEPGPGRPFRDTHVRLEGPVVRQMERSFFDLWEGQTQMRPQATRRSARRAGTLRALMICETYRRHSRALRALYRGAFGQARRRIWITNAYFVPEPRLRRALLAAARRGVDVRVIVPGPTDVPLVRWASRALQPVFLANGVRLFEYTPRILHAKNVVIDDEWALVGSTNLDHRSFAHNLEAQALVLNEHFTEELAGVFERDAAESTEVTLADCRGRSRLAQLFYRLFYRFWPWL